MRKAVVCCLALLFAMAVRPAAAGIVYIPIVERNGINSSVHDTEVWVSNGGQVTRSFVTTFLLENTDGVKRTGAATTSRVRIGTNGTFRLSNTAPADKAGLLEVDASPQLLIDARLVNSVGGSTSFAPLPLITSDNMVASGDSAHVLGLERQTNLITDLSVVNLGKASAQCEVKLFRANGSQITAATITIQPLSLRRFGDALAGQNGVTDARAQVTCNQNFFAFGTFNDLAGARMGFAVPSASGASTLTGPGPAPQQPPPPPPPPITTGKDIVYSLPGNLLTPSKGHEVREEDIHVPKALALKSMVIELDFYIGAWYSKDNGGPHAVIWLYRNGSYRSNTIANVNVHGPTKNKIRMNQNLDLPGLTDSLAQQGAKYEVGKTYHFFYKYDATINRIRCKVTQGSTLINDLEFQGSAANRTINVPASGFRYVLGHRAGLHYEVPSYGWTYSNVRVVMTQY